MEKLDLDKERRMLVPTREFLKLTERHEPTDLNRNGVGRRFIVM